MQLMRIMTFGAALAAAILWSAPAMGVTPELEFFEKRIRPVLVEHCYECHSATSAKLKGGLRLDGREFLLKGGETGPSIVPGKPEGSLLIKALAHSDPDLAMPPKKPKLQESVIADFQTWIHDGAQWPAETVTVASAASKSGEFDLAARKQRLPWIWETPKRQTIPAVKDGAWPQGAVDRFILARLEKEGLKPAPPAAPEIWLRRVYFALIGLPPTPEELTAFLNDHSATAREWVVDKLLASPQFGERWARHWLDLVRYAESRGHEEDYIIPNAFEYRDYVIRALNSDVPYDAFVREHLAGDLMKKPRRNVEKGFNESIIGTGWTFLGEEIHAPVDTRQDENERIDNRIDVMSKAFLGLTVACARCHDHKFDAISQRDYYALAGFFISSGQRMARFETMDTEREVARLLADLRGRWTGQIGSKMAAAQKPVLSRAADYLIAAAEVLKAGTNAVPKSGTKINAATFPKDISDSVARMASEHSLNTNLLGQWAAAVLNAVNGEADLLHPFALAAVERENPAGQGNLPASDIGLPEGARVVVDFGKCTAQDWFPDGVAYGPGPLRAGQWQPVAPHGNEPASLRLVTLGAAQFDADWRELDLAPGVEHEQGMYGGWRRDGLTLRSPKFELTNGHIYYLVRGSGKILASVDSQHLVTGPVHTDQIRQWEFKDRWHWVAQDLSDYPGHRVAMEFSPGNEFDTSIALIIESEKPPVDPWSVAARLAYDLKQRKASSLTELATAYQEILRSASADLSSNLGITLQVQNWLAQHPELFSGKLGEWAEPMAGAWAEYLQQRDALMTRVQWKSRTAPAMLDGNPTDEYLLSRGKHQTPKGLVPRRFLEGLAGPDPIACQQGSGREELARLMTDPANPLLSRVFVNRVWHHLFGRGIVATVDNFGWLGQRPTHPELLDELAATFVEEDHWSLKHLLRRLVLSRAYAMSSKPDDAEQHDPENLLLHRMNLQRLEGEAIRDEMVAVSGRLDLRMYGPSVPLHPSQFVAARGLRGERGPLDGAGRRSIYVAARRNFLPMMMSAFDTPTPFTTVGRRNVSNVPGQMLFLMNDPFVHEQAEVWGRRILADMPKATPEERIRRLFLSAYSREPSVNDIVRCRSLLFEVEGSAASQQSSVEAWTELCHALFGVKEFMYVR